jgi:hypothetical protein
MMAAILQFLRILSSQILFGATHEIFKHQGTKSTMEFSSVRKGHKMPFWMLFSDFDNFAGL